MIMSVRSRDLTGSGNKVVKGVEGPIAQAIGR